MEHAVPVRPGAERLHTGRCPRAHPAIGRAHPPSLVARDDWGEADLAPGPQPGLPARARVHGSAAGLPPGPEGGAQPSGTAPQGPACGPAPPPRKQPPELGQVALLTALACTGQPGASKVTTSPTVSAAGRSREKPVPGVALQVF